MHARIIGSDSTAQPGVRGSGRARDHQPRVKTKEGQKRCQRGRNCRRGIICRSLGDHAWRSVGTCCSSIVETFVRALYVHDGMLSGNLETRITPENAKKIGINVASHSLAPHHTLSLHILIPLTLHPCPDTDCCCKWWAAGVGHVIIGTRHESDDAVLCCRVRRQEGVGW